MNAPTGTQCNTVLYETDEEEFDRPAPVKRAKKRKTTIAYNLGYLSLWWRRMERDAEKAELERGEREKDDARKARMKKWLSQKQRLIVEKDTRQKRLELGQVCPRAREGGDSPSTVRIPAEHPVNKNQYLMQGEGNTVVMGERGLGVEGGKRGVMPNPDEIIYERSQPSNVISEHHPIYSHTEQTSMCSSRGDIWGQTR